MEIELKGGVANAGAVTRVDDHVLRRSNVHTPTIHRFLRHLAGTGFAGVPVPIGVDPDGRERLGFIDGDVPLAPFPLWARSDDASTRQRLRVASVEGTKMRAMGPSTLVHRW